MTTPSYRITCPTCAKRIQRTAAYFPFCSKRCQTIDLARWADGSYRIAGKPCSSSDLTPEDESEV